MELTKILKDTLLCNVKLYHIMLVCTTFVALQYVDKHLVTKVEHLEPVSFLPVLNKNPEKEAIPPTNHIQIVDASIEIQENNTITVEEHSSDLDDYMKQRKTSCFRTNRKTWMKFNELIAAKTRENHQNTLEDYLHLIQDDIKFLELLMNSNALKIFVTSNNYREPNINADHCAFDIDFVEVNPTFYRCGNGERHIRYECDEYSAKCQSYDISFALDYVYKQYNNIYKYVLFVEDDISFCARLFEYIYNITIMDEYSTISIDVVFLSTAFRSYLVKTSHIPSFKEKYINAYQSHEAWNGFPGAQSLRGALTVDKFMQHFTTYNDIAFDSWNTNMYVSDLRLTFHPSSSFTESIMNRTYAVAFNCYKRNDMRRHIWYAIQYNSMEIYGSLLPSKHETRKYVEQARLYCDLKQRIMTNHSYLQHFLIQNCSKLIQIMMQDDDRTEGAIDD